METNAPALMFVELPTLDGDISIEASKIIGIRQDKQSKRHAWVDTGREYAYSITFPADYDFETDDARNEILHIMFSAYVRSLVAANEPPLPVYPYDSL